MSAFPAIYRRLHMRSDLEFLPAALEVLETPPSPVGMRLIVSISAFAVAALTWSCIGRVDVVAVAQGKLQPTGRVKTIQPLETSRVAAALVENGQRVRASQVLVELDPAEARADTGAVRTELESARAETIRRRAEADAAIALKPNFRLSVDWPASIPLDVRVREERVYAAEVASLAKQIASLAAEGRQKRAEVGRLEAMIAAEGDLIATLTTRVSMKSELMATNAGSKASLLETTEALQTQKMALAQQTGQLAEAHPGVETLAADEDRAEGGFAAENAQKLAEAERRTEDAAERLGKANTRLDRTVLRSPIDGVVQSSSITTPGQVVSSGQELMRVVPDGAAMEIECYLPNKDVGFVKEGDRAVVKVESFPFTRYGTIDAVVTRVARDAIPEPDADMAERDGTRGSQASVDGGAQRMQNLVYAVTLRPMRTSIEADGASVPLSAGMAVTAEIRTGSRRIIEYLFSPLAKVGSEAMRER